MSEKEETKKDEKKKKPMKKKGERLEIEMTIGEGEDILVNPHWESLLKLKLPVKFNYWLKRIQNKIRDELKDYFEEKQEAQKKYVKKDKEGEPLMKVIDRARNFQQFVYNNAMDRRAYIDKLQALREEKMKLPGVYQLQIDFDEEGNPTKPEFKELTGDHISLLFPLLDPAGFDE